MRPDQGYAGALAVANDLEDGIGTYELEVALMDGSNSVNHFYDLGNFEGSAIGALGSDGLLLS